MAKVTNNFLKGKMNKDLDERLVPKGEYREAQNILITQSEGSDVGAIENILGNALSRADNFVIKFEDAETIGHYADVLNKRIFWFITNFTGDTNDVRSMSRASVSDTCKILMIDLDNDASEIVTLVDGNFLNFSKDHLITGVNLIDDLLFWTDNYNQPRKINVTKAIADSSYYTKEEQISVAKVAPYLAPILHDSNGNGDTTTLTNDGDITSDYLKDRFVRFSYRYKYEDGEYTTMAPFTQIIFKPLNQGQINNVLSSEQDVTDVQDVYSKTIVDIMKNNYNQIELRIPLPSDENLTAPPESTNGYEWDNELNITKIEILIKESDQDVVKVIKEIDVTDDDGASLTDFLNNIDIYNLSPAGDETYHRHVYKFIYKSEEPYKILKDDQITRVFDQVPVRAKAQEISGNRIIYGNFTENYNLPKDSSGKTGVNYVINNITKGDIEEEQTSGYTIREYNKNTYKYNSLKQRRKYQVGIVLADKFGRQSPVILSTSSTDTITTPNISEDLSSNYLSSYSWSTDHLTIGKSLSITFQDNNITDNVYNGDIDDPNYNPYGWYSWKLVVKQQEQEYDNIYTSHPADHWNNESNSHDDVLGYTWVSLYGDNINKVPRDVSEVNDVRENVAGSDVKLFPKVIIDKNQSGNNLSIFGRADQDPLEVMTVGTAREQGILTKGDRDKDRVHDFVMSKRNPLLAQLKSLGIDTTTDPITPQSNNRVNYKIDVDVIEENVEDRSYFTIGDGNDINPYIRVEQEVALRIENRGDKWKTNLGKKVFDVRVDHDEQRDWDSKTIMLDGDEISDAGGSARIEVGQIIDYRLPSASMDTSIFGSTTTIDVSSHSGGSNAINVTGLIDSALANMILQADQGMDAGGGSYTPIAISGTNIPVGTYIDISATADAIQAGQNIIYLEGLGSVFDEDITGTLTIGDAGAVFAGTSKTTATIEEHGDHFAVRRPILQKVELNKAETRTILHFDRRVFPEGSVTPITDSNELLALYDPLLIKSVETITKVESGQTKYYQKIKLDHEVKLGGDTDDDAGHLARVNPSRLVIQNLEEEPIAVDRGLTVLETDPIKSKLDIFYETSTSGLVKDLNLYTPIHGTDKRIEVSYFNTFILTGGGTYSTNVQGEWHVEEARIKGEFNGKSIDFGVRAHLVDDEYTSRIRGNAMIYSGIFNAKTKLNNTNQFSIGESITKAVDIQNGSIQKLYAEDTNLIIFQENKVSRALIDKDAIFTAEGQPLTASSKVVIGQVGGFMGKYGISRNPESFAVYGGRKYFADKNRGLVLRLSQDGLTPISDAGMRSFFRDNLYISNRIYGMYDEQKNKYIVSLQSLKATMDRANKYGSSTTETTSTNDLYTTLSFDEASKGWVSFYTYKPTFGFSISNKFYTFYQHLLYEHYREDMQRCKFYTSDYTDPAEIEFVLNDQPNIVKNFLTIDYEGTSGWKMDSAETDTHTAYPVLTSDTSVSASSIPVNFLNKENRYYGHLRNNTTSTSESQVVGVDLSGTKGYYNKITMQYWKPGEAIASSVNKAELFAVGNEAVFSSQ